MRAFVERVAQAESAHLDRDRAGVLIAVTPERVFFEEFGSESPKRRLPRAQLGPECNDLSWEHVAWRAWIRGWN